MARYAARHASTGDPARDAYVAGCSLRDRLTRDWLAAATGSGDADIVEYDAAWWDGAAFERCLVIDVDGRRLRVVETEGEVVVLPMSRRKAGRLLAERRRPRPAELTVSQPRPPSLDTLQLVVVTAPDDDVRRCSGASCGALLPVNATGPCPRCGSSSG